MHDQTEIAANLQTLPVTLRAFAHSSVVETAIPVRFRQEQIVSVSSPSPPWSLKSPPVLLGWLLWRGHLPTVEVTPSPTLSLVVLPPLHTVQIFQLEVKTSLEWEPLGWSSTHTHHCRRSGFLCYCWSHSWHQCNIELKNTVIDKHWESDMYNFLCTPV